MIIVTEKQKHDGLLVLVDDIDDIRQYGIIGFDIHQFVETTNNKA